MLIGILSDSHGKIDITRAAVNLLLSRGAKQLIHCGDVGGETIIDLLASEIHCDIPVAFVLGNNDYDREELASYARSLNVTCLENFGEIEIDAKKIAVTHGDNPTLIRQVISQQAHDYLLVGHSHVMSDQHYGRVRMINPGALYRAVVKSVAMLDTKGDRLEFLPISV